MYNSLVDKKPIVAASYSLGGISSLILSLLFSYVIRLLSAEIFFQSFQKSFTVECYNYIRILTAVLQEEFHKTLRFFFFSSQGFTQTFLFLFFLDLFFSEVSAIITAAAAFFWVIFLELLEAESCVWTTSMNSVWTTCMLM